MQKEGLRSLFFVVFVIVLTFAVLTVHLDSPTGFQSLSSEIFAGGTYVNLSFVPPTSSNNTLTSKSAEDPHSTSR